MHGCDLADREHCFEEMIPFLSIKIASPGSTSLRVLKPKDANRAFSDAITYSFLFLPSRSPITNGLIP